MSDSLPREAVEAHVQRCAYRHTGHYSRDTARRELEAALPFLRESWKKELLSDEVIGRIDPSGTKYGLSSLALHKIIQAAVGGNQ